MFFLFCFVCLMDCDGARLVLLHKGLCARTFSPPLVDHKSEGNEAKETLKLNPDI